MGKSWSTSTERLLPAAHASHAAEISWLSKEKKKETTPESRQIDQINQDFHHDENINNAEFVAQSYNIEEQTTDDLKNVSSQTEISKKQQEINNYELHIRLNNAVNEQATPLGAPKGIYNKTKERTDYFTTENLWTVAKWWGSAFFAYNAIKKIQSYFWSSEKENDQAGETKDAITPTQDDLEKAEDEWFLSKFKKMAMWLWWWVSIARLYKKLYKEKKSVKEIYHETIERKVKTPQTQPTEWSSVNVPIPPSYWSWNPAPPNNHKNATAPTGDVSFEQTGIWIVDKQKEHEQQSQQILSLTHSINKQFANFTSTVDRYSTMRVSNVATAMQDIQKAVYGTDGKNGLFPSISSVQQQFASFTPTNEEEKQRKSDWETTINDMYLFIADAFAFKLNKNLRNTTVAKSLYLPFVQQLLNNNGEKAKDYAIPPEPSVDEVFAHIKQHTNAHEVALVSQFVETYGVEQLIAPDEWKQWYEAVAIFDKSYAALHDSYKHRLFEQIQKIYQAKDNFSMTTQERKALWHFADIIGAQWFFDLNNDKKDRWIRIGGASVCVIGWVALTIASGGIASGAGIPLAVWWMAGVATSHAMSYIDGREYLWSEYAIEGIMGAVPLGIASKFQRLRVAHGVSKAYQLSNSLARNLLLKEIGLYTGTGVAADILRSHVSEHEFGLTTSVFSNLWFAFFPVALQKMWPLTASLKNIPRKFLGVSDQLTSHVQKELHKIKQLRLLGNEAKADKLWNKLQRKIWQEKALYEKQMAQEITAKNTALQNNIQQQQVLEKKWIQQLSDKEKAEYAALQTDYAQTNEYIQTLQSLQAGIHKDLYGGMVETVTRRLEKEIDALPDNGSFVPISDTIRIGKQGSSYHVEFAHGNKVYSSKQEVLDAIQKELKKSPQWMAHAWVRRLSYLWSDTIHQLHWKKIKVGKETYKISLWDNKQIRMTAKDWSVLSEAQISNIAASFEASIVKELDQSFMKFTSHARGIKTPLAQKLGIARFDSPAWKKTQHMLGVTKEWLKKATYGDLWEASKKFWAEKTPHNFLRAALGGVSWTSMIANSLMLWLSYSQAEHAGEIFTDFVRFRLLGMADIAYVFYETGMIESGIDAVHEYWNADDYEGAIRME